MPVELSDGLKKGVGLARAIFMDAAIITVAGCRVRIFGDQGEAKMGICAKTTLLGFISLTFRASLSLFLAS